MTIPSNREILDSGSSSGCRVRGAAQQVINEGGTTRQLLVGESGSLCVLNVAAAQTYTLPAIGANDVGMFFEFTITVDASGSYVIITGDTADFIGGSLVSASTTPGDEDVFAGDPTSDTTITLDAVEDGWLAGGYFTMTASSTTVWTIGGIIVSEPAGLTPFS